jgi:hypothetical protein
MQKDYTQEWNEYQSGVDYNTKINYYANTDLRWKFYNDKQWVGVVTNGLSKWQFNICKSAINYFTAFICSQKVKMQYSAENIPDEPTEENELNIKKFTDIMSNVADMKWEKDKMDSKLRQLMLEAGITGDYCAYVYWDPTKETGQDEKGDFCTELVDGGNVMFGNPNNPIVEAQPYILIVGREMVSKLKEEAKANKIPQDDIDSITADEESTYQAGEYGKIELDSKGENGKTLYIIKLYKKNSEVYWNKSTKYCPIRKDVAMGIKRYPIAWGNWEQIKNSYHGNPVIEGIIDNQIGINQLFAMVAYWMRMAAFGKVAYDKTRIASWSNQIGSAIGVEGDVTGVVQQLQAGNFNAAILQVIDMAIKYTKEFIGANDTLLGQVNPEQASGVSIISTAKQASMPLGNMQASRDQFVEDLGLIWGEFMLKKYKNRKVSYKQDGKVMTGDYNSEGMDNVLLQCKVDVGPSSYWSELSGLQSLDNLLTQGKINKLQYFERVAKMNIIPDCQGLIKDAQEEMKIQAQMQKQGEIQQQADMQNQQMQNDEAMMQETQAKEQQFEQMAQFMEQLPEEVQQKIMSLPEGEQEKAIMQLMQQDVRQTMKGGVR